MSLVPEASPTKEEDVSTGTVERHSLQQQQQQQGRTSTGRKRGRPSKADIAARLSAAREAELEKSRVAEAQRDAMVDEGRETVEPDSFASAHESPEPAEPTPQPRKESLPAPSSPLATSPIPPSSVLRSIPNLPSTPRAQASPAQSARQAVVSPSPSPQASDAENQPPSCRPPATQKRVVLAPMAATPARTGSPSKRNVLGGLRSTTPWTAVDVEMVFDEDKENEFEGFVAKGSELTSPERRMTVEQWIYYNAERAEARLKHECEGLVSRFESEGSRAMNVLEGMVVD
ncbi:hypothetical protein F5X68DRAFT_209537 [Plectosphaerella plurivora]|uniref:Uncharacterized protein n=1 Tax=Plectosphaerella plurivora TaxID=936078 RepID=A0A9P9A7T6_9PEZI|nr:hypothetical protein F5X68DRAFT_209537 [Plectosphaerella plurivora]